MHTTQAIVGYKLIHGMAPNLLNCKPVQEHLAIPNIYMITAFVSFYDTNGKMLAKKPKGNQIKSFRTSNLKSYNCTSSLSPKTGFVINLAQMFYWVALNRWISRELGGGGEVGTNLHTAKTRSDRDFEMSLCYTPKAFSCLEETKYNINHCLELAPSFPKMYNITMF